MEQRYSIKIDITLAYGRINLKSLQTQCKQFMTGVDAQNHANQNNQMMQASIWDSLTLRAQQGLAQYKQNTPSTELFVDRFS